MRRLCAIPFLLAGILLAQTPSAGEDLFQRGLLALQSDHLQEALEAFTAAETQHPEDARVHNFRGITLMWLERMEEAAAEYRRAIELDGQLESAFRNLGYLEWTAHQDDQAREHLQRALSLAAEDSFAGYYLARLEAGDGHPQKAIPLLKKFADRGQAWSELDLALTCLSAGIYEEAVSTAQSLLQKDSLSPGDHAALDSVLGIAEAKLHRDEEALAGFREAARLAPRQEEYWLNLTRHEMELKRVADAIASTRDGLEANPKSYALHLRLGAAHFSSGKYDEAEKVFRELVSAGDPLPTSTIGLAQVLLHTGRAAEAATLLTAAEQRLGPQFLIVYFEGLALDHAGKRAEALACYQRAVVLDPNSVEAHLGVGKTSLILGKTDEAIAELQKVLQEEPGNLPARRLLSRAYAKRGDQANATKYATDTTAADSETDTSLVGDFILPDWQQPPAD